MEMLRTSTSQPSQNQDTEQGQNTAQSMAKERRRTILDAFLAKFYQCRIRRPFSPCYRTNYYVSTLYLSHSDRLFVPTLAKGTILCYTACLVWPGSIPGCS